MVDLDVISAFVGGMNLVGAVWEGRDWLIYRRRWNAWFFWLNLIFCALNVLGALT